MPQRRNKPKQTRRRTTKRSRKVRNRRTQRKQRGGYFYFSNPPFKNAITSYAGPQSQDAPRLMTIEETYEAIDNDV